jgi:hypothetical protein
MQNLTVDHCTLELTGQELITILSGLHELPHKLVVQLLNKIEQQVVAQNQAKNEQDTASHP